MSELLITYTVPVSVLVDVDTGEVVRVVVEDEFCTLTGEDAVTTDDGVTVVTEREATRALDIADTAEWPAWEFGW